MKRPIMTIGHSTMDIDEFVARCKHDGIQEIVDIRSHPTSKWEQFRQENMPDWLAEHGIRYLWEPNLGGWTKRHSPLTQQMFAHGVDLRYYAMGKFPKQRIGAGREATTGPEWTNQGLYDYAWYTTLPEFQAAAKKLVDDVTNVRLVRPAIMCCEFLWWKCHRSMVADYLVHVYDWPVYHIQPRLTPHAAALGNRIERYPIEVRATWPV